MLNTDDTLCLCGSTSVLYLMWLWDKQWRPVNALLCSVYYKWNKMTDNHTSRYVRTYTKEAVRHHRFGLVAFAQRTHKHARTHLLQPEGTYHPPPGENCLFIIKTTNKCASTWHAILERVKQNKQRCDRETFRRGVGGCWSKSKVRANAAQWLRDAQVITHKIHRRCSQPLWSLQQNNELSVCTEKKHYTGKNKTTQMPSDDNGCVCTTSSV